MKARLLALRSRYPRTVRALVFAWSVGRSLLKHNALEFSSALAYTAFFSLVPILALLGFVLGALVRRSGTEAVLGPFFEHAPEATRTVVMAGLDQLADANTRTVAPLAVLGFLWIASSGAHGSMDILELMLAAPARAWWRKRALALAWILGFLAVAGTAALVIVKLTTKVEEEAVLVDTDARTERALHEGEGVPADAIAEPPPAARKQARRAPDRRRSHEQLLLRRRLVWIGGAASRAFTLVLVLVLALLGLAGFYRIGVAYPKRDEAELARRRIYPGAMVALVGFFVVSSAFGLYVARFGRYVTYYGGLATMAVLLLWLYLTAFAFLLGAEVNALLEGRRALPTSPHENAGMTSAKGDART